MEIISVPLNKIKQRANYRAHDDVSELMASIKEIDLLQPIGLNENNEIVFGNRRFQAMKKLGRSSIPCVYVEKGTGENMILKNVTENIQRQDVPLAVLGQAFYELYRDYMMSKKEIAARVGKSVRFVDMAIDTFTQIPEEFRSKIYSVGKGKQYKGYIPSATAAAAISLKKEGISTDVVRKYLTKVSRDSINAENAKIAARKIASGADVEQAFEDDVRFIRVSIAVSANQFEKMTIGGASTISSVKHCLLRLPGIRKNQISVKVR